MAMDVIDYHINGEGMQYVEIELDPNESAVDVGVGRNWEEAH